MPDSKLAEKLGFEIRDGRRYVNGVATAGFGHVGKHEIALWNLCLELSERLAREQVHLYEFHHCNCERKDA